MRTTLMALALVVLSLLGFGIVLLATASSVRAQGLYGDPHFFVNRQLIWMVLALGVAWAASRFDYHWWKETPALSIGLYLFVVLALMLVFVPGIGVKVKGSYRWLGFGPFRVQPSEFAKFMTVVVMSVWMDRIGRCVRQFWKGAVIPVLGFSDRGVACTRRFRRDDGGLRGRRTADVCGRYQSSIWILVRRGLLWSVPSCSPMPTAWNASGPGCVVRAEHRAYQLSGRSSPSRTAGLGVSGSTDIQSTTICEAHTDFIFAIGGEEFGFLFQSASCWPSCSFSCAASASVSALRRLGRMLAFGMAVLCPAGFNINVVTGCLPTKD